MSTTADDWLPRHRISVDEYYRMAEVGLLAPDARVELIQGEVIDMVPIGSRHAGIVSALTRVLVQTVQDRAVVSVQQPVRLDQRSEPQPDIALLKPRADFYVNKHPAPADVLLLIEVSDTTLRYDSTIKLPLYARHRIPEIWIVDVEAKVLTRARRPASGAYQVVDTFDGGEIELPVRPVIRIELDPILGL